MTLEVHLSQSALSVSVTEGSSEAKTSDEEDDGVYEDVGLPEEKNHASGVEVTGDCVTVIRVGDSEEQKQTVNELEQEREGQTEEYQLAATVPVTTARRNPSPYYYGDLFRDDNEPQVPRRHYSTRQQQSQLRQSVCLATPPTAVLPNRISVDGDGSASVSSLILSEISPCSGSQHAAGSAGSLLAACLLEWDAILMPPHRHLRAQQDLPSVCACAGAGQCLDEDDNVDDVVDYDPRYHHHQYDYHYRHQQQNGGRVPVEEPPVDYDVPEEGEDEYGYDMSGRQRHLYETAFDCRVSRSDDDLDDVDRVTNHPVLRMFGSSKVSSSTNTGSGLTRPMRATSSQDPAISVGIFTPKERRKVTLVRGKLVKERPNAIPSRLLPSDSASSTTLSQDLDGLEIDDSEKDKPEPSPPLPLRGYSPSPPSTAPLPAKFHGNNKDILAMNSIRSAPNLPSTSPAHPRLKDMRLPVKSLRARELPDNRKGSIMEFKGRPRSLIHQEESVPEFKGRPRSMFVEGAGPIVEFKGRPNDAEKEEQLILEFKGRPGRSEKDEAPALDFSGRQRGLVSQESGPILEFKGRPPTGNRRCGVRPKSSSTESMATSSSGGSLESIRSSTSEGNRSTTSSESHRSSSLSSHSSDSASSSGGGGGGTGGPSGHLHHYYHHHHHHHHQCSGSSTPLGVVSGGRFFSHQSNKLHILSPISDKSSQEPASETSDNNRNNNSQKASPEDTDQITSPLSTDSQPTGIKLKRRTPQNKNLINLTLQHHQQQSSSSGDAEIQGSDSGISIESRGGTKGNKVYNLTGLSFTKQINNADNGPADNELQTVDFSDLPFDMPKLRRRRLLQQDTCTSGSATSVDLHDLPFDMPKLRRRLRCQPPLQQQQQTSTESSGVSQASSSQSVRDADRPASSGNRDSSYNQVPIAKLFSPTLRLWLTITGFLSLQNPSV